MHQARNLAMSHFSYDIISCPLLTMWTWTACEYSRFCSNCNKNDKHSFISKEVYGLKWWWSSLDEHLADVSRSSCLSRELSPLHVCRSKQLRNRNIYIHKWIANRQYSVGIMVCIIPIAGRHMREACFGESSVIDHPTLWPCNNGLCIIQSWMFA